VHRGILNRLRARRNKWKYYYIAIIGVIVLRIICSDSVLNMIPFLHGKTVIVDDARAVLFAAAFLAVVCYLISRIQKLHEQEKTYIGLMDFLPYATVIHSGQAIMYANEAALKLVRATEADDVVGRSIWDFVHPDFRKTVGDRLGDMNVKRIPSSIVGSVFMRVDGEAFLAEARARLIQFGGRDALQVVFRDLTSQVMVDMTLQLVAEHTTDLIHVLDRDFHTVYASPSFHEHLGIDPNFYLGKSALDFIHPDDVAQVCGSLKEAIRDRKSTLIELRKSHVSGSWVPFESRVSPVFDRDGNVVSIVIVARNISERKQSETRLRNVEQRHHSLLKHNIDIICEFDSTGNMVSANPVSEKITGYREEELLGTGYLALLRGAVIPALSDSLVSVLEGDPYTTEMWLTHKDGRRIDISIKILPIIVAGSVEGFFTVARDITEKLQTEQLLRQSDRLSVVGQFAAGIAHEIRNPLTAIRGFLQLLQVTTERNSHYLDIMRGEIDRINDIVGEFLLLSKPQSTVFKRADLCEMLNQVIVLLRTHAIMDNVEILAEFDQSIPQIDMVSNELKQVFINVIKNAIEAMRDGGQIQVQVERHDRHELIVRVVDQGVGIPVENLSRMGEPFYTTKEKGTGLGLMICHRIVQHHGGRLQIHSVVNEGTCVEIVLPVPESVETRQTQELVIAE